MKIAVVHDWLVTYGGAERVLEQILKLYPESDLYSLIDFIPSGKRDFIQNKKVETSFMQKLPFARTKYRSYLPLMPLAIEQFDLSDYDLIISSSHAVAKGVLTGPEQLHISYCNNYMTYAWDMYHLYFATAGLEKGLRGVLAKAIMHYIRIWDVSSSKRPDYYVANSRYMAGKIKKYYGREAAVIYPHADYGKMEFSAEKDAYYVTVARIVPIKRVDLIVKAFGKMPQRKLIVVGDGPELHKIRYTASSNVQFVGFQSPSSVSKYISRARAFIFASMESFGIAVVEAQACGTPVIAFGKGGALETVIENQTGLFFDKQDAESIVEAVERFERVEDSFDPAAIRRHAMRFSAERFRREFKAFVDKALAEHFGSNRNDFRKSSGNSFRKLSLISRIRSEKPVDLP